jgi:hypothetical protein
MAHPKHEVLRALRDTHLRAIQTFKIVELTPKEMLKVATDIAKAERTLRGWHDQRKKRLLIAHALLNRPVAPSQTRHQTPTTQTAPSLPSRGGLLG